MIIGGLQKFSLLDYPGKVAAIIFTQGCNFRCHFCYNPMLVWPDWRGKVKYSHPNDAKAPEEKLEGHPLNEGDLFVFLKNRRGKLDGVVITGGEPTLHPDLPEFLTKVKELGYQIKLDTNGTNPEMLARIVEKKLADYIAMDLKTSLDNYEKAVGVKFSLDKIKKSIKIIKESGLPHEWRTTVVPGIVGKEDIEKLGKMLMERKSNERLKTGKKLDEGEKLEEGRLAADENWYLQSFKSETPLVNEALQGKSAYAGREMEEMKKTALKYVKHCEIR